MSHSSERENRGGALPRTDTPRSPVEHWVQERHPRSPSLTLSTPRRQGDEHGEVSNENELSATAGGGRSSRAPQWDVPDRYAERLFVTDFGEVQEDMWRSFRLAVGRVRAEFDAVRSRLLRMSSDAKERKGVELLLLGNAVIADFIDRGTAGELAGLQAQVEQTTREGVFSEMELNKVEKMDRILMLLYTVEMISRE